MTEYTLVMQAVVTVRINDRIEFTPAPGALMSEDRRFAQLCKARKGQECVLLQIEQKPDEESNENDISARVEAMKSGQTRPIFKVRFLKDGHVVESIGAHHFTRL